MNKLLPYLELIFLAALAVALVLQLTGAELPILMTLSLAGLGITFFLNAYKPPNIKPAEGEQLGFNELLGLSILPKVLWISSAVATIGVLFYTLELGNDGYLRMLYIGGSTIMIASVINLILWATGTKYLNSSLPVYFRALPILLVVAYLLLA